MSKPTYEELEAQLHALVAEKKPMAYIIQDAEARSRGNPGFLSYDWSISEEDINEYEISITPLYVHPATDAAIAALRAEGVEMAASERWGSGYVFDELNEFASQLRQSVQVKGVQS